MPSTLGTLRQIGQTYITTANTIYAYGLSVVIFTYLALTIYRKVNVAHISTENIVKY